MKESVLWPILQQARTHATNGFNFDVDKFHNRFAELIIQECGKVIVDGGYWSGGPLGPRRQCTPPEIAQMIKEHFGVEE